MIYFLCNIIGFDEAKHRCGLTIFRRDFMTNKSDSKFVVYNAGYGVNISVIITNGELSEVANWGTRSEDTHNIETHPNWRHAESICTYNIEDFLSMAKLLKKNSKGFAIIKK